MRRRPRVRWTVLLIALLAVSGYVASDLLDPDAGEPCSRLFHTGLAVDLTPVDFEFSPLPDPQCSKEFAILRATPHLIPDVTRSMLRGSLAAFQVGSSRIHLVLRARRTISTATRTSPTADPV